MQYSEQIYWKSFNEPPKGGLSNRAITTDFAGKWYTGKDPLNELKHALKNFPTIETDGIPISLYKANVRDLEELHYVVTESKEEFRIEIISPLQKLWDFRSKKGIAHMGELPKNTKYIDYYREIATKICTAISFLIELINKKIFS